MQRNTVNHWKTCMENSAVGYLQFDSVFKEKFNSLKQNDFYASLNEATFPNLRRTAQKMLVLFGSTYVCEQTFSVMNINKSRQES